MDEYHFLSPCVFFRFTSTSFSAIHTNTQFFHKIGRFIPKVSFFVHIGVYFCHLPPGRM
jgi:hypothetical protein